MGIVLLDVMTRLIVTILLMKTLELTWDHIFECYFFLQQVKFSNAIFFL